ncbi:uncharacterized protein METZ01_LOCUS494996, partial [marine metagenome]
MRLVTVGRSIYGVLLPDERRKFRFLFLMSLASSLLEAVGAVLVLSLLTQFTS